MEASEVTGIIEREVNGNWSVSNAHGVDLKRCLIVPIKRTYENSFRIGETVRLWHVLEEVPEDKSGYKVVFDEESGLFGLAVNGTREHDVFIGFYGTFLETLEGM